MVEVFGGAVRRIAEIRPLLDISALNEKLGGNFSSYCRAP
jgi:hypothetical protein